MGVAAGIVCRILLPISISSFSGNGKTVAVCTLSSLDLLQTLSKDAIMDKILIAGRLYSENKGIDDLVRYCTNSDSLKYLIICGHDTKGHYSGDALVKLMLNGTNSIGHIVNTMAPRPYLSLSSEIIEKFRNQITIVDMREVCEFKEIKKQIYSLT